MRNHLNPLPTAKQREPECVAQIRFEEFADAAAIASSGERRNARILKVFLYGRHARGGWIHDAHDPRRRLT